MIANRYSNARKVPSPFPRERQSEKEVWEKAVFLSPFPAFTFAFSFCLRPFFFMRTQYTKKIHPSSRDWTLEFQVNDEYSTHRATQTSWSEIRGLFLWSRTTKKEIWPERFAGYFFSRYTDLNCMTAYMQNNVAFSPVHSNHWLWLALKCCLSEYVSEYLTVWRLQHATRGANGHCPSHRITRWE